MFDADHRLFSTLFARLFLQVMLWDYTTPDSVHPLVVGFFFYALESHVSISPGTDP